MRAHPGKLRDHLAERKVRVCATRTRLDLLKPLVGRRLVLLVWNVLCGRADDHSAVDGRRDENTLAHFAGALKHRSGERAVLVAVEHQVLPAPCRDGVFRRTHEIAYLVGVDARAVHDSPRNELASILTDDIPPSCTIYTANSRHLRVEEELRAVRRCVLSIAKRELVGAADAARRRPERGCRLGRDVRFAATQLALRDYLGRDAVPLATLLEFHKCLLVFRAKSEDERAVAPERDLQLAADVFEHPVAKDVELRLVRPRLRVESCVDYRAVRLGRALGNVATRLKNGNIQIPARKFPRRRAPDHARADHYDISLHP